MRFHPKTHATLLDDLHILNVKTCSPTILKYFGSRYFERHMPGTDVKL